MSNNTSTINPSILFYNNNKKLVHNVRESLFSQIGQISLDFELEARKILESKLKSNHNKPLLGELFPWIINDLIDNKIEVTHKISVAWLAIYLYTLFLDDYVDDPKPLSTSKFLTGSILAQIGLTSIGKITSKTRYEKYVEKAFFESAYNQSLDTKHQKQIGNEKIKIRYSKGKNHIILACAGALAAENSKYSNFITTFTNNLLLSLQYLDDIADYKNDLANKNFTVLLNYAFKKDCLDGIDLARISDKELLVKLISTGALERVLKKIQTLLTQSLSIIQQNNLPQKSKKVSINMFVSLNYSISEFNSFLKENSKNFMDLPKYRQDYILDKTEKFLPLIAQST